jgi:hypothetical protein
VTAVTSPIIRSGVRTTAVLPTTQKTVIRRRVGLGEVLRIELVVVLVMVVVVVLIRQS